MDERTKAILSAAIVLIVNVVAMFNIHLDQGVLTDAVFGVAALIADIYAIWKNHNFTPEAAQAQAFLDGLKGK